MNSQSSPLNKEESSHDQRIHVSSNMEPDVAQQFIAEIGFSSFFYPTSNAPRQQNRNKEHASPNSERIAPSSSPIAFGQRINGYNVLDSFQLVKDQNGLSWWYDTSDDSDDDTEQQRCHLTRDINTKARKNQRTTTDIDLDWLSLFERVPQGIGASYSTPPGLAATSYQHKASNTFLFAKMIPQQLI
ncbi:unnamed protein product [Cylindrotheca closterium]|uniref:Uncharacterized protein n=1 Tax=Cylindrotheca closterium TaxID=2856 RepID=A0AAD2FMJ5_9STRA|nr:unnamed protein product [Cylindrotheca closterium]